MIRRKGLASLLAVLAVSWSAILAGQETSAYFSPNGGTARAIATELATAKQSIDVAAYQLTLDTLNAALATAAHRGVKVRVIVDRSQERPIVHGPSELRAKGPEIRTDHREKLFHNKYAVIDRATVITGSYNWSANAERRNAENCVIIHNTRIAEQFATDFQTHWNHAAPFAQRPDRRTLQNTPRHALTTPKPARTLKGT